MYHLSLKETARQITSLSVLVALLATVFAPMHFAFAAAITGQSDTMSTLTASAPSDHTIVFTTPSGAADTETITLTFESGFNLTGINDDDIEVSSDVDLALSTTDTVSGQTVTITLATDSITAGAEVTVNIGSQTAGGAQIVNPALGDGSYTIDVAGSFGDTGTITVTILSDDQVAVSADVAQSMSFSINDTSIGFGTLELGSSNFATADGTGTNTDGTAAHTLTAGTNASNGYTITAQGATLSANAGADTITALAAQTAASPGTEQFGLRIGTVTGGVGAGVAAYTDAAAYNYAGITAAPTAIASSAGASANTIYDMHYLANISSNTEAGSYTTTITYVATANF